MEEGRRCTLETFKCDLCKQGIWTTMDGFMPICCPEKVICESCYHQNYGRVKCGKCGGYSRCNLIRGQFFEKAIYIKIPLLVSLSDRILSFLNGFRVYAYVRTPYAMAMLEKNARS